MTETSGFAAKQNDLCLFTSVWMWEFNDKGGIFFFLQTPPWKTKSQPRRSLSRRSSVKTFCSLDVCALLSWHIKMSPIRSDVVNSKPPIFNYIEMKHDLRNIDKEKSLSSWRLKYIQVLGVNEMNRTERRTYLWEFPLCFNKLESLFKWNILNIRQERVSAWQEQCVSYLVRKSKWPLSYKRVALWALV